MSLDPGAERLLKMLAASGAGAGAARSVAERRRMLQTLTHIAGDGRADGIETRDLQAPGPAGPIRLHLHSPLAGSSAALVYLHGGGWVAGGFPTHDGLCRRLAASARTHVFAVEYRLAPEHRFPAAFDDALAAVRWVAQSASALGLDPARLAIGGDSVGAGLAAAVAQSPDAPRLALQVLLCPILAPADQAASRRLFAEGYFVDAATVAQDLKDYCGDEVDPHDPRVSPLLGRDLANLPRALIHAAEYDPFRDEAEAYAERLSQAGVAVRMVCWPGMIHDFYMLPRAIAAAGPALEVIGREIAEALA